MADPCIVCLGDLRTCVDEDPLPGAADAVLGDDASKDGGAEKSTESRAKSDLFHTGGFRSYPPRFPSRNNTSDLGRLEDLREIRRISLGGEVHPRFATRLQSSWKPPVCLSASEPNADLLRSAQADEETIAHLLPCKHDLHNACLKPWVERANSCPICRTKFNMVELSRSVGGEVFDSYAVQDKVQEAEVDPGMVVEDELFDIEAWEPCLQCGVPADGHGVMYCDGCDRCVHVFCAGYDDAPEVWYCETCLVDMEGGNGAPRRASTRRRAPRRGNRAAPQRALWARVWMEVSRQLDLDLDFPFDEEPSDQRTEEQRREFRRWERRFEVADRQGAANRLRGIAAAHLQPGNASPPEPESQEEIRAWNAFDKARESQEAPVAVRRSKRRATDSPASPHEDQQSAQPQLKRPRLRRPMGAGEPRAGESSDAAARRNGEEPTFLSSLLREVELKPMSAGSPTASDQVIGQYSPRNSSPMGSPSSSAPGTPQAGATPPPQRPSSPPLSSTIVPAFSPVGLTFSPFSPTGTAQDADDERVFHARGRRRQESLGEVINSAGRASSSSPSRALSYSAKEEIQRMVKLALGTRYRDKEISKDQYTEINRDVSRRLYELVGNASALSDHAEREKWQQVANDEVQKAITALSDSADHE